MENTGYNLNLDEHKVKRVVNAKWFSLWKNYSSKAAVMLPSITCGDIELCKKFKIFSKGTRFLFFEHAIRNINQKKFQMMLEGRMNQIFKSSRNIASYSDLIYDDVKNNYIGLSVNNNGKYDFANYDTCSMYQNINEWWPGHIQAFKKGSPVFFTFDADYSGRYDSDGYKWLLNYSNKSQSLVGVDFLNGKNLKKIDDIKENIGRLLGYLNKHGLSVRGAELYKEDKIYSKIMVFICSVVK